MKIDFNKLIELLLPTFLRRPRLFALLRTLISKPLQSIFSRFHIWRAKSRYEASVTPQVCSLTHAVERTFDCVCEIKELDGKPYDFLVSIDRSTDLNAIREFIDKHKLAGKSYLFKLGDVFYSAKWLNFADENLIERYAAKWRNHIGEHDGNILIFLHFYREFDLTNGKVVYHIDARTQTKVKSNIRLAGASVRKDFPWPIFWVKFDITIEAGTDSASTSFSVENEEFDRDIVLGIFEPTSDATYKYEWTIVYFRPGLILPLDGFPPLYVIGVPPDPTPEQP